MIEVAGLRKTYGGRAILDGIDLVVRPGELVALLGPNGAGKTTTVEIIEGYRTADAGSVRVLGEDPRGGGPALRARVGLMLQGGAGLEPRATVRDLVGLFVAFHDRGPTADELIDRVGLGQAATTRARRLSGGERQRLSLALALTGNPEVLILDEPTAGMDPEARRATRELVAELRDEGRSVLLTTHDLGDVEHLADRVAILQGGRIVADSAPEELVTAAEAGVRFRTHATPDESAVQRLRARLASTRPPLGVRSLGADERREGATFQIEAGAATADVVLEVARWAAKEGLLLVELQAGATSLEERYLELTGDRDVETAG